MPVFRKDENKWSLMTEYKAIIKSKIRLTKKGTRNARNYFLQSSSLTNQPHNPLFFDNNVTNFVDKAVFNGFR